MTWTPDVDPARTESRTHPLAASSGPPRWLVAIDVGGSGSRLVATTVPSGARPDAGHPAVSSGDAAHRTELTGRSVATRPGR